MNAPKLISACLIMTIALAAGCSKDDDNNFYAGYSSPGKFRPKGIAWEKSYNFAAAGKTCSSAVNGTGVCGAVHCVWYSSTTLREGVPTEGIAANDRHLDPANFTIKITRNVSLAWDITMVIGGVKYTNVDTKGTNNIELVKLTSTIRTDPFYDPTPALPDSGDEYEASTSYLKLVFVRFTSNIILYSDPNDLLDPTKQIIIAQTGDDLTNSARPLLYIDATSGENRYAPTGDYMIVQDHGL